MDLGVPTFGEPPAPSRGFLGYKFEIPTFKSRISWPSLWRDTSEPDIESTINHAVNHAVNGDATQVTVTLKDVPTPTTPTIDTPQPGTCTTCGQRNPAVQWMIMIKILLLFLWHCLTLAYGELCKGNVVVAKDILRQVHANSIIDFDSAWNATYAWHYNWWLRPFLDHMLPCLAFAAAHREWVEIGIAIYSLFVILGAAYMACKLASAVLGHLPTAVARILENFRPLQLAHRLRQAPRASIKASAQAQVDDAKVASRMAELEQRFDAALRNMDALIAGVTTPLPVDDVEVEDDASLGARLLDLIEGSLGARILSIEVRLGARLHRIEDSVNERIDSIVGDLSGLRVDLVTHQQELAAHIASSAELEQVTNDHLVSIEVHLASIDAEQAVVTTRISNFEQDLADHIASSAEREQVTNDRLASIENQLASIVAEQADVTNRIGDIEQELLEVGNQTNDAEKKLNDHIIFTRKAIRHQVTVNAQLERAVRDLKSSRTQEDNSDRDATKLTALVSEWKGNVDECLLAILEDNRPLEMEDLLEIFRVGMLYVLFNDTKVSMSRATMEAIVLALTTPDNTIDLPERISDYEARIIHGWTGFGDNYDYILRMGQKMLPIVRAAAAAANVHPTEDGSPESEDGSPESEDDYPESENGSLLESEDGSVLSLLESEDGSVLSLLESEDGSVLSLLDSEDGSLESLTGDQQHDQARREADMQLILYRPPFLAPELALTPELAAIIVIVLLVQLRRSGQADVQSIQEADVSDDGAAEDSTPELIGINLVLDRMQTRDQAHLAAATPPDDSTGVPDEMRDSDHSTATPVPEDIARELEELDAIDRANERRLEEGRQSLSTYIATTPADRRAEVRQALEAAISSDDGEQWEEWDYI